MAQIYFPHKRDLTTVVNPRGPEWTAQIEEMGVFKHLFQTETLTDTHSPKKKKKGGWRRSPATSDAAPEIQNAPVSVIFLPVFSCSSALSRITCFHCRKTENNREP